MRLPINEDGNIELDLFEIVSEVMHKATEEERQTIWRSELGLTSLR